MSDARLRELERRARLGEGRGEWLVAALRAGALTPERVRLAAACGDAGAAQALGEPVSLLDAGALAAALQAGGRDAVARAALGAALAEANLRVLAGYAARLYGQLLTLTLRVAEAPDDPGPRAALAPHAAAILPTFTWARWRDSREGLAVVVAARCVAAADGPAAWRALLEGLHALADPAPPGSGPHAPERWEPYEDADAPRVLEALDRAPTLLRDLRAGLAGWALGEPPSLASSEVEARLRALHPGRRMP